MLSSLPAKESVGWPLVPRTKRGSPHGHHSVEPAHSGPQGLPATPDQMTDFNFLNLILKGNLISRFGVEINCHWSQRILGLSPSDLGVCWMVWQGLMSFCDKIGAHCCYGTHRGRRESELDPTSVCWECRGYDVGREALPIPGHICLAVLYSWSLAIGNRNTKFIKYLHPDFTLWIESEMSSRGPCLT